MHIVPGFLIREIAGETVAIPTGQAAQQLSGLIALNDSGKFLFDLLQADQSEEALIQALTDAYDVDESVARTDVAEFLALLRKHGMLVEPPRQDLL